MPLVFFHGTPGAAGPFDPLIESGRRAGRAPHRVLAARIRRFRSSCQGRSVASCVADVVAIADALGYDRFYCSGGSGGGPHSIACAALIPDRVIAVGGDRVRRRRSTPRASTGRPAWARRTSRSSAPPARANVRSRSTSSARQIAVNGVTPGELLARVGQPVLRGRPPCRQRRVRRAHGATARAFAVQSASGDGSTTIWRSSPTGGSTWTRSPLLSTSGTGPRIISSRCRARRVAGRAPPGAKAHLRPDDGHLSITLSSYGEILDALLEAEGAERGRSVSTGTGTLECYVPRMLLGRLLEPAEEDLRRRSTGRWCSPTSPASPGCPSGWLATGKEGAEHLVDAINACFSALLARCL